MNNTIISIISIVVFVILMTVMYFKNNGYGVILKCKDEPIQIGGELLSYVLSALAFVLISWYNGLLKKSNFSIVVALIVLLYILIPEFLSLIIGDPDIDCDTDYDINDINYWKDVSFKTLRLVLSLIFFTLVTSIFSNDSVSFKTGILGRKLFNMKNILVISIIIIVFLVLSTMYLYNKCDEKDSDRYVRNMMNTQSTILMISMILIIGKILLKI